LTDGVELWADRLEDAIRTHAVRSFDRVVVLARTGSTQDAAFAHAGGRAGLVVTAARQTDGHGRLGRSWADDHGLGIAVTFVLDSSHAPGELSLAGGLAACQSCERALSGTGARVGLRWPNDVVETPDPHRPGRKLAGVLVERRDRLTFVGVGINVLQPDDAWPDDLQGKAVSLKALGSGTDRIDVIESLLLAFDRALREPPGAVADAWRERNTLIGSHRRFVHNGREVAGTVRSLEPTGEITVDTPGGPVRLPTMGTSLVHE